MGGPQMVRRIVQQQRIFQGGQERPVNKPVRFDRRLSGPDHLGDPA